MALGEEMEREEESGWYFSLLSVFTVQSSVATILVKVLRVVLNGI